MSESIQILVPEREWREFADTPGVPVPVIACARLKFQQDRQTTVGVLPQGLVGHPGGEEYYVLEGVLEDLGKSLLAGSYIWHPPGSAHRPASKDGCVVLVVLPEAVELLG